MTFRKIFRSTVPAQYDKSHLPETKNNVGDVVDGHHRKIFCSAGLIVKINLGDIGPKTAVDQCANMAKIAEFPHIPRAWGCTPGDRMRRTNPNRY